MMFNWLHKGIKLTACLGIAAASVSASVAQTYNERTAIACMQLDAESVYASLKELGWRRVAPTELTDADKRILSTAYYFGATDGRVAGPKLKQSVKIAEARVEQRIARIAKGSTTLNGAFFRSQTTEAFIGIEVKETRKFKQTSCTFYLSNEAASYFRTAIQANNRLGELERSFYLRVAQWNNFLNGTERQLDIYFWNAERMANAIGEDFPVDAMAIASAWQHAVNME
jgi:hypothetical protein